MGAAMALLPMVEGAHDLEAAAPASVASQSSSPTSATKFVPSNSEDAVQESPEQFAARGEEEPANLRDTEGEPPAKQQPAKVSVADERPDDWLDRELQSAVRNAINYLSGQQKDDGSWSTDEKGDFTSGVTGLCTLSLVRGGVKASDLRIRRAVAFLRTQEVNRTYNVVLQTLALCAVDPNRDRGLIERNAAWLEETMVQAGPNRGSWSYGNGPKMAQAGDRSNAEFALWGLDAAARAGAKVKSATWSAALTHWLESQNQDGGWSYAGTGGHSTGSMTASGIVSVAICLSHLTTDDRKPTVAELAGIERGLSWLGENFAVGHNPGTGPHWLLYYVLTLRRAGDATRRQNIGEHDWRRELTEYLVTQQNRTTGNWSGAAIEGNPTLGTALALLALAGVEPVVPARIEVAEPPAAK
jgi:hypothetical protein